MMSLLTKWILMHQNTQVATVELLERSAAIAQVTRVHSLRHAPLGTVVENTIDPARLENWLGKRAIPASRKNIDQVLETLKIQNTRALALKSYGLSLSDHYWLRPEEHDVKWRDVNFFQNEFSTQMGEVLFENQEVTLSEFNFYSPDSSADGWLEKKWIIDHGTRVLVKGANRLYLQEPYNEKIASDIMERLGINHIPYTVTDINNKPYSLCENFVTIDTELIPAMDVVINEPQIKGDTRLTHLLRACENLGMNVDDIKTEIDKMLVLDYLIGNYDRHWRNFGFIRDVNTLEFIGFSPIFDSGASLWQHHEIIDDGVKSETFADTLKEQLDLISDFSWYNPIPDDELKEIVLTTLDLHPRMQVERKEKIANQVVKHSNEVSQLKN